MSIVARFFPNGEFSHGSDTSTKRKQRRHKERRHEPLTQECRDGYLQWKENNPDVHLCIPGQAYLSADEKRIWVYTGIDKNGNHIYDVVNSEGSDTLGVQMNYPIGRLIGDSSLSPLVHQMSESSPAPEKPSRKKLLSMTKNMSRNIRNGVYLLEQWYGKQNLSFLTLTLPNLSTNDLALCCNRWDYMTDQILKWLRKRLLKLNIQFEYVYCTEIQSKRLQSRGEYAPHLHIVFRGRNAKKTPWAVTPKQVRKAWAGIVRSVVGHSNFTTDACENLQRIKFSAARYLSKYMSKGNCRISVEENDPVQSELRTQWGGMARIISQGVKKATVKMGGMGSDREFLICILQNIPFLLEDGVIKYYKEGYIVTSVCPVTGVEYGLKVGCGCLRTPTYEGGLVEVKQSLDRVTNLQP
jgi:hypothetical protein